MLLLPFAVKVLNMLSSPLFILRAGGVLLLIRRRFRLDWNRAGRLLLLIAASVVFLLVRLLISSMTSHPTSSSNNNVSDEDGKLHGGGTAAAGALLQQDLIQEQQARIKRPHQPHAASGSDDDDDDEELKEWLDTLLATPCKEDDDLSFGRTNDVQTHPYLVSHVRKHVLKAAGLGLAKRKLPPDSLDAKEADVEDPSERQMVSKILVPSFFANRTTTGLFFEAGALDAHYFSDTYYLEKKLGWTGLLAEMNPLNDPYINAGRWNRSVLTASICLSPQRSPCRGVYAHGGLKQPNVLNYYPGKNSEIWAGSLTSVDSTKRLQKGQAEVTKHGSTYVYKASVDCYPLTTLLLAANMTNLDYINLDLIGSEKLVLGTIDWDQIHIKVLRTDVYPDWHDETAIQRTFTWLTYSGDFRLMSYEWKKKSLLGYSKTSYVLVHADEFS